MKCVYCLKPMTEEERAPYARRGAAPIHHRCWDLRRKARYRLYTKRIFNESQYTYWKRIEKRQDQRKKWSFSGKCMTCGRPLEWNRKKRKHCSYCTAEKHRGLSNFLYKHSIAKYCQTLEEMKRLYRVWQEGDFQEDPAELSMKEGVLG